MDFFNFSCTMAYVTQKDISRLGASQEQTVIVVKAPEETKLEVPSPTEVKENTKEVSLQEVSDLVCSVLSGMLTLVVCVLLQESIKVHLKGGKGPIMVLTCDIGSLDAVNGEKSGCFVALEESRIKTSTLHTGKNTTE